jgi:hypothetical protein
MVARECREFREYRENRKKRKKAVSVQANLQVMPEPIVKKRRENRWKFIP